MVREDYAAAIATAQQPGPPTSFWTARVLPAVIINLHPTPDKAYPVTYWRFRQPQDVSALVENPDAPVLWSEAVCAGLAARLALKFLPGLEDKDKRMELRAEAEVAFQRASDESRERAPLRIEPMIEG
jgi:hypothetical protein